MPTNTYKCSNCDFQDEYIESFSIAKENWHPEYCPKCNEGKLEKIEDWSNSRGGFDIIGSCYTNDYGRKAWKKHLSKEDQIKVLTKNKDPY
jgi:hypothetical protein